MVDDDLRRTLNMVHGSPRFVSREDENGEQTVLSPELIPADSGIYVMAGTTTLPSGAVQPAGFVVDSASGELHGVYWPSPDGWISSSDPDAAARLGLERSDVFPFDWQFAVPLERDVFHDDDATSPGRQLP